MTKATTTVYRHPDGFELTYGEHELTACTPEGIALSMPIGLLGLAELAEKLAAIAGDAGNQSEQYGSATAIDCLNELLATDSASERIDTIQSAILSAPLVASPWCWKALTSAAWNRSGTNENTPFHKECRTRRSRARRALFYRQ